jgi:aryl-alcohol dehydrogenase-like predicted oxidoreductase
MVTRIDRRCFLKLGAMSTGVTLGCGAAGEEFPRAVTLPDMRYRALGNTGLRVSEIAFGAHGVDNPPLMAAALEAGINTFCTSGRYLDGMEEAALGEAMAGLEVDRDRLVVMTGNAPRRDDSVASILGDIDASLRRLQTDVIDVYYNASVETAAQIRSEPLHEAIERAREVGKVRHLGLSAHGGDLQTVLGVALQDPVYEVFFIKYDFMSYPDLDDLLERALDQGVGTIVFKTTAGNRQHEIRDLEKGGLSFRQATLKWALMNPAVASVAVTLTSFAGIEDCLGAVGSAVGRAEVAMLWRYADAMRARYCRLCRSCEAHCRRDVAIADVNRHAMYLTCYGRVDEATRWYRELPDARSASTCVDCEGGCDAGCPFGRAVRHELVVAHRQLCTGLA